MILIKPSIEGVNPVAFQGVPVNPDFPWSHLQIIGGRQVLVFAADGDLMGTFDLALTAEVKIIRKEGIVRYSEDGNNVHIATRKERVCDGTCGDDPDDDDDPEDLEDEYGDDEYEWAD
jgi:hypothetical protein